MMIASPSSSLRLLAAVWVVWNGLAGGVAVRANPVGPQILHGSVSFDDSVPSNLRISQGSERAVIDWRSFSIAPGEVTQFFQPGSGSATLNRVRGSESSLLEGSLRANGSVYLLNPNGVIVGKNGRIDAGGFLASSLDLDSEEFLRGGDLQFRGSSNAPVINLGQIHAAAGDVFLIAPQVINEGSIRAPEGTVGLAAGNDVLLTEGGDERVFVRGASGSRKDVGVDQRGAIEASRAELKAHGGNLYALAIRNEGRVAATGVNRRGGQIYLSANGGRIRSAGSLKARRSSGGGTVKIGAGRGSEARVELTGTVDASGEVGRGGRVEVTGESLAVGRGAAVTANGPESGGEIFVGGGQGGRDPVLPNSETVTVEEGARLEASATERGEGGRIVVFANGYLGFGGTAAAQGGISGGGGGFVELSGKQGLEVADLARQVDVSAPAGRAGTLLIDPVSIGVIDGVGGGVAGTTVTDDAISAFLATGNLILANDVGGGGDITVNGAANISWAAPYSLSFQSDRDFVMNPGAVISGAGTGGVKVEAVRNAVIGGSISMNTGNIEFRTDAIDLTGTVSGLGGLKITPRSASQSIGIGNGAPGALNLTATEVAAMQNGFSSITIGDPAGGSGSVVVNAITFNDPVTIASWNGAINVLGQLTGAGDASVTLSSSGPVANATFLNAPVVTHGNAVTILDQVVLKATSIDTTHGGLAPAGATVTITGPVNADAVANNRDFVINAGSTGGIQLNGAVGSSKAVRDVNFQAATLSLAGAVTAQRDITLVANGISLGGAVSGPGLLTIAPRTAGTTIGIGDGAAGTLQLSTAEVGYLQDGFAEIRIGNTGSGNIHLAAATFVDPLSLMSADNIYVDGVLRGEGNASVRMETVSTATTYLNADVVTQGNAVTIQDRVVLSGSRKIDTTDGGSVGGGANVTIGGEVAGPAEDVSDWEVRAGSLGAVQIDGAIGIDGTIGKVKLSGASVTLSSSVTGQDDLEFLSDQLSLGGAVSGPGLLTIAPRTAGTTIGIGDGAAGTLQLSTAEVGYLQDGFAAIRIGNTGSGNIHLAAATFVDPLSLMSADNIYVDGVLRGEGNASVRMETVSAATTYLNADVVTQGNAVTIQDRVVLSGSRKIDTTDGGSVGGGANVTIGGEVAGPAEDVSDLEVQAGSLGAVQIDGAVGSDASIGKVKLSGASVSLGSSVTGQDDLEFLSDQLSLGGAVSGPGLLTIAPRTAGTTIGIGDGAAGTLQLSTAEVGYLQDGFAEIRIGNTGSGNIHLAAATFVDPLSLMSADNIYVDGVLRGEGNASVRVETVSTETTYLNADVVTQGNAVTIQDRVVLSGSRKIDTTDGGSVGGGANVTIGGEVAGPAEDVSDWEVRAGSLGAVQIDGAIGSDGTIGKVKLSGASVSLGSSVTGQDDLEFLSDQLSLGGAVSGPGLLTIAPRTAGTTIGIGDGAAGTLQLSTAEVGYLQDGFAEIRIGSVALPSGPVEIRGGVFSADLTVQGSSIGVTNLRAGAQRVSLRSSAGGIADLGDSDDDITAAAIRLTSSGSIGAAGDAIRLSHGAVVAAEAAGGIFLDGSCDLTVGMVDGVQGLNSTVGGVSVAARGLLRVEQRVQSAGDQLFQGSGIWTDAELATTGGRTTLAIDDGGWNRAGLIDVHADVQASDGLYLWGGGGDDRFRFSLLPTSFPRPETGPGHGGAGYDILDFSPVVAGTPLEFDLAAQPGLVDGIDHVIGTADHRDRVILPTFGDGIDVVLTGPDQFTAGHGEKSFASFEYVTGSSDPDLFAFQTAGQLSGGIDGAGGDDVIQGTSQADLFEILTNNAGTARGTSFVSIERVLGGAGDDRFNFRNQATLAKGIDGQGNSGGDAMLIDDSNLQTAQTYVISNGVVTRNPVYLFGGIEYLTLLAGQGNDDITTNFQDFSQQISGGNGLDTIHVKDAVSKIPPLRLPGYQDIRLAGIEEVDAGAVPKVEDLVGRTGQENGGNVGNNGGQVTDQFSGKGGGGAPSLMGANGPGGGGLGGLAGLIPGLSVPGGDLLQSVFAGVNSLVSRNFGIVSFNGGPPPSPKIRNEIINNTRNSAESELSSATTLGGTIEVDPYEGVSSMSSGASDTAGQVGTTSLEFSVSFAALAELGAALGLSGETGVGRLEGVVSMVLGDPAPGGSTQAAIADALSPESLSLLFLAIGGDGTVTIEPSDGILLTSIGVEMPGAPALLSLQGNTSLGSLMELVQVFGASGETALSGESGPVTLDPSGIPPSAQLRIVLQVSNGVLAQHLLGTALGLPANWTAGADDGAFQLDCSGSGLTPGQTGSLSNQLTPEARNELEGSFWQR